MSDAYQTGWNDGYSEGYACKLADATEPFNPQSLTRASAIEAAAAHIEKRYRAMIGDSSDAIGMARGILKAIEGAFNSGPADEDEA